MQRMTQSNAHLTITIWDVLDDTRGGTLQQEEDNPQSRSCDCNANGGASIHVMEEKLV